MRWDSAAARIIRQASGKGSIDSDLAASAEAHLKAGGAIAAFRLLQAAIWKQDIGWNRLWEGDALYMWYGPKIVSLPLRALTLELEGGLPNLWSMETLGGDGDWVRYQMRRCGIDPDTTISDPIGLKFLRRLNLDARDRPYIERWHWSDATGTALLSDGGKFQIRREAVWAWTLELLLSDQGHMDPVTVECLRGYDLVANEVDIAPLVQVSARERFFQAMRFYGMSRTIGGALRLTVQAGEFPGFAVKLWGE